MNLIKTSSRILNPSPLTLDESTNLHHQSLEAISMYDQEELSFDPEALPDTPVYSEEVKTKPESRLDDSMVFTFNELLTITKPGQPEAGAVLIAMTLEDGIHTQKIWLPKKCCANLDLDNSTICVWDQVAESKIDEFGPFFVEPEYYPAWKAATEEY